MAAPPSEVTVINISMSAWSNLSVSRRAASADSEVGSPIPPADSDVITGMPKNAVPTMTSTATAMTRRGAAMASRAIAYSTTLPSNGAAPGINAGASPSRDGWY
jgi:hypothetical protein